MRTGRLATSGAIALAALASVVVHGSDAAQVALVAKGRIEGAAGAVWLGVFGDDAKQAGWTQVAGGHFEVELPPGESATILAIGKDRVPRTIPMVGDAAGAIAVHLSPGLSLAGTVRSEEGWSLAAEITARPAEGYGFEVPAFAAPRWRSAPTGEFEIGGLQPGQYVVEASAEGHVTLVLDDVRIRDGESNRLDLELAVGAFVTGWVLDGEGGPAVDVEVRTRQDESIVGLSGADGAFRLGPFSVGQSVNVFARSAEMDSTRHRYVLAPYEGLLLEFPRHALLGHVVDAATGAPVQRYRVVLFGTDLSRWEHRIEAGDGIFRVPLDAQVRTVVIHAKGYGPWVAGTKRCGEECRLGTIQLRQQLSIAGRVVDARNGQPIAGATIEWLEWRETVLRDHSQHVEKLWEGIETDENGAFELSGLPSTPASLVVVAPRHHREEVALAPTTTDLIVELDFRDAGPTIAGRLALADGTPVTGSVRIHRADGVAISFPPRTTPVHQSIRVTDETGEFRYEGFGLPDGEYWLEPHSMAGVMERRAVVVENGQSVEEIQLLVKAGRQLWITIAGLKQTDRINRLGGGPLAAVTVEDEEGQSVFFKGAYRNGSHLVRGLPEGPLFVSARARPHLLGREVGADQLEVEFNFAGRRSRIAGTVTMEGRPLPDFVVRAAPLEMSGPAVEVRTTDSGHYDARGLSEGTHVVVTATGHIFEVHVAGDTPFDIDLPPASLAGIVRDQETGLPVSYARVRLYRAGGDSWSEDLGERADTEGQFRFDGLATGEYYLEVWRTGFDRLSRHVRVAGHEVLELELKEQSR